MKTKAKKRTKWTAYRLFHATRSVRTEVYGNLNAGDTWADLDSVRRKMYNLLAKHINEN